MMETLDSDRGLLPGDTRLVIEVLAPSARRQRTATDDEYEAVVSDMSRWMLAVFGVSPIEQMQIAMDTGDWPTRSEVLAMKDDGWREGRPTSPPPPPKEGE